MRKARSVLTSKDRSMIRRLEEEAEEQERYPSHWKYLTGACHQL